MPNTPSKDQQSDGGARSPCHARPGPPPWGSLGGERTCPGGVSCLSSHSDAGSDPAGSETCNHKQKGKARSGAGPRKGDEADGAAPSAQRIFPPATSRDVGGGGCRSQHPPQVEMPVQTSPPGAGHGSGHVPAEPASSRPLPVPPRVCGLTPPGPVVRDASRASSLPAGSTGFTAGQGTGPPWGTTSPWERDAPHTTTGLGGHEATVTAGRAARSYDRGARATSTHRRAAYQCCRAIHSHLERREGGGLAPGCRWPCPLCPAV